MIGPTDQPDSMETLNRQRRHFRYLWMMGVALFCVAVWYIGWDRIGQQITSANPLRLTAMAALLVLATWMRAMKWRWVLGAGQHAIGAYFLSKGAGGFSPARMGELAPLLLKRYRTPRMAAWIILDRLLETAATLGLGLAGAFALGIKQQGVLVIFAGAFVLLVVWPFIVLHYLSFFKRFAGRLPERLGRAYILRLLSGLDVGVKELRNKLLGATLLSFACTCLDIYTSKMLYLSFGYTVSFSLLATVQCAHGITSALPFLPNATGVPYAVAAGLLFKLGHVPETVLTLAVGINVVLSNVLFWTSFTLGSIDFTTKIGKTKQTRQGDLFDRLAAQENLYVYDATSLSRIKNLITNGSERILDIGCGDGAIGFALGAPFLCGLDLSFRCIRLAKKRGLYGVVADARQMPFAPGTFDTVLCVDVLHHLPDDRVSVLAEADHLLKPGGHFIIVEPDARYLMVRWTQAPWSPIRVAPCDNEPAIYPEEICSFFEQRPYLLQCNPIHLDGKQVVRDVFPLWQRLLKAPFVLALALWHGKRPNKFVIVAQKAAGESKYEN